MSSICILRRGSETRSLETRSLQVAEIVQNGGKVVVYGQNPLQNGDSSQDEPMNGDQKRVSQASHYPGLMVCSSASKNYEKYSKSKLK